MAIGPQITSYTLGAKSRQRRWQKLSCLKILVLILIGATFSIMWSPFLHHANAGEVTYDSALRVGGTSNDTSYAVAADAAGNIYYVGAFPATVDFDPGAGTSNLTAVGNQDVFVSKLDPNGNLVWAKSFGGTGDDYGYYITLDTSGNVYTTGYFSSTVDFDPGAGTSNLTSNGASDIFVSKLDSDGNFVWAKNLGGSSFDYGYSIKTDTAGNVYTTGEFTGTADFDPGAGVANLTSAGFQDIFISKLDSNGNFVWVDKLGSSGIDNSYSITLDGDGNVYTTGAFSGTADFDPGAGTANLVSAGGQDVFVSKLDSDGNYIWAKNFGGAFSDIGQYVTVDSGGNVYTTGEFGDTADFDPGAGTFNLTTAGASDIFVSKLDSNGDFVWAQRFGGTGGDASYVIAVDDDGNVYTTGTFRVTADFDPGAGTYNLVAVGNIDAFVSKLDPSGNFVWAQGFGGTGFDSSVAMALDNSNNVYTAGSFQNTVDFDPGAGTANLVSAGGQDVFVLKLSQTDVPTVTTSPASALAQTTVTLAGDIINTGNLDITDRGFDYGLTTTYTDQVGESGTFSTGAFTSDLTSLTCGTTYHYRAFATNSLGTSVGSDNTFDTSACTPSSGGSSGGPPPADPEAVSPPPEPEAGLQFPTDYVPPTTPLMSAPEIGGDQSSLQLPNELPRTGLESIKFLKIFFLALTIILAICFKFYRDQFKRQTNH